MKHLFLSIAATLLAASWGLNAQALQSGSFLNNLPELKTATKTADGIYTVEIQPLQVTDPSTGQTVEYALNKTGNFYDPVATVWQDSPVFSAYATTGAVYLLARSKANATHAAGVVYHHAVYLEGKCNCSRELTLPPIVPPPVPVSNVSLNKTALTISIGDSEQLTATVSPFNAANKTVSWATGNAGIATVAADGTVTAVAIGTATITATAGGKTATCTVTVAPAPVPVSSISLNKTALTISIGGSEQLIPTVLPANATDKTVNWTTGNAGIATVSAAGTVTAVAIGTATITATAGGKTATCAVTVAAPDPSTYDPGVVINGVKWATRNVDEVGTFAATPESYGKSYQWNRKVAWDVTGTYTDWDTSEPTGASWTAAHDPSPAGWRVPTLDELLTLLETDKVIHERTTQNGVNGCKFTDKTSGESVFFPAVSRRFNLNAGASIGTSGFYWSSSPALSADNAYYLRFLSSNEVDCVSYKRSNFLCVRAVLRN